MTSDSDRLNRELSWLAFNGRVLQEAADPSVPLFERLTFLSIFSSNLDEFFRVRVASRRAQQRLKKKRRKRLEEDPAELLSQIHHVVWRQQEEFGRLFREDILPGLAAEGIVLLDETGLTEEQVAAASRHFEEHVRPLLDVESLAPDHPAPFLHNREASLVVELRPPQAIAISGEKPSYVLVDIPSPPLDRFVTLPPNADGARAVIFLDDVIRLALPDIFPDRSVVGAYAVKLTRDAELYIEDEFSGDMVDAIRRALAKRDSGPASRFLYDMDSGYDLVDFLKELFGLEHEDLVVGGRYHNLHDLASFPDFGRTDLKYEPWPPTPHPELARAPSVFEAVARGDRMLHFPYQSYDSVVDFLCEAAADPGVEEIWLTVYRVSDESAVLNALIEAAEAGKKVHVFVEVKARFDEESNLLWGERLEAAGVVTHYSLDELKIHAKIALVVRREGGERGRYAYLSTGNFNERTARFYADIGLLTADPRLTVEVERVLHFLAGDVERPTFEHLVVAPFGMREWLRGRIADESAAARGGRPSRIVAKMNALEDDGVVTALQAAEEAGVPIDLVVRGICTMVPSPGGPVSIRSIVDRYLEHWRAWRFHAKGRDLLYLASADWMTRNLDRRVEVAFPIYDDELRGRILDLLDVQLRDNVKARIVDGEQENRYVDSGSGAARIRAQEVTRDMIAAEGGAR